MDATEWEGRKDGEAPPPVEQTRVLSRVTNKTIIFYDKVPERQAGDDDDDCGLISLLPTLERLQTTVEKTHTHI